MKKVAPLTIVLRWSLLEVDKEKRLTSINIVDFPIEIDNDNDFRLLSIFLIENNR